MNRIEVHCLHLVKCHKEIHISKVWVPSYYQGPCSYDLCYCLRPCNREPCWSDMKPPGAMLISVFHPEFMPSSMVMLWHQVVLWSEVHVVTKGHVNILTMLPLKAKLMSVVYAGTKCQVNVSDLFSHLMSCDINVYATPLAWS